MPLPYERTDCVVDSEWTSRSFDAELDRAARLSGRWAGTQKALAFGINPFNAALLGMVTGIGGGVLNATSW